MKKILYIWGILSLVTILSACWKQTTTIKTTTTNPTTNTNNSSITNNPTTNTWTNLSWTSNSSSTSEVIQKDPMNTMIALLKNWATVKCNFSIDSVNGWNWILYVDWKNKLLRTEVTFTFNEAQMTSYSIIKDKTVYSRNTTLPPKWIKAQLDNDYKPLSWDVAAAWNLDKQMKLDCSPWQPDEFIFQIPWNVSFTNMQDALKLMEEQLPKSKEEICKQCDLIKANDDRSKKFKNECIEVNCKK